MSSTSLSRRQTSVSNCASFRQILGLLLLLLHPGRTISAVLLTIPRLVNQGVEHRQTINPIQRGSFAFDRAVESFSSLSDRAEARRNFCASLLFSCKLVIRPFFLMIFFWTLCRFKGI